MARRSVSDFCSLRLCCTLARVRRRNTNLLCAVSWPWHGAAKGRKRRPEKENTSWNACSALCRGQGAGRSENPSWAQAALCLGCTVPWPGRGALRESRGPPAHRQKKKELQNLHPWGKLILGSMTLWLASRLGLWRRLPPWTSRGYCWKLVFICSGLFSQSLLEAV